MSSFVSAEAEEMQMASQLASLRVTSGIEPSTQGAVTVFDKATKSYVPYGEAESFEELGVLSKPLLDACVRLNWVRPSAIQVSALKHLLTPTADGSFRNMIAQAKTGSGKTGAFVMTILERINKESFSFQALILCHSRELAIQTFEVVTEMSCYLDSVQPYLAVPNEKFPSPWRNQIVIGTPGTLLKQIFDVRSKKDAYGGLSSKKDLPAFLQNLKIFVIDEADELLSQSTEETKASRSSGYGRKGRGGKGRSLTAQVKAIWNTIRNNMHKDSFSKMQCILTSATFPPRVKAIAGEFAKNPVLVTVKKRDLRLTNIALYSVICEDADDKFLALLLLLGTVNVGQAIVFRNTVSGAQALATRLKDERLSYSLLYAGLGAEKRDTTMQDFRDGKTTILVSSNVIARGLDVPAVKLVVNYDIPVCRTQASAGRSVFDGETFMHRTGRTGRFGLKGACVTFLLPSFDLMLGSIEKSYELPIQKYSSEQMIDLVEKFVDWVGEGEYVADDLKRRMLTQETAAKTAPEMATEPLAESALPSRIRRTSAGVGVVTVDDEKRSAELETMRQQMIAQVHATTHVATAMTAAAHSTLEFAAAISEADAAPLPDDC